MEPQMNLQTGVQALACAKCLIYQAGSATKQKN